jgi:hypothetical protein
MQMGIRLSSSLIAIHFRIIFLVTLQTMQTTARLRANPKTSFVIEEQVIPVGI